MPIISSGKHHSPRLGKLSALSDFGHIVNVRHSFATMGTMKFHPQGTPPGVLDHALSMRCTPKCIAPIILSTRFVRDPYIEHQESGSELVIFFFTFYRLPFILKIAATPSCPYSLVTSLVPADCPTAFGATT